jgi:hypothetical protein
MEVSSPLTDFNCSPDRTEAGFGAVVILNKAKCPDSPGRVKISGEEKDFDRLSPFAAAVEVGSEPVSSCSEACSGFYDPLALSGTRWTGVAGDVTPVALANPYRRLR